MLQNKPKKPYTFSRPTDFSVGLLFLEINLFYLINKITDLEIYYS